MFKNELHLTVNEWMCVIFIICVPIINIIFLIIWALDKDTNVALRNFSRGFIKLHFIALIIGIGIVVALNGNSLKLSNFTAPSNTGVVSNIVTTAISAEKKITFSNVMIKNNLGMYDVSGEVTNSDTKAHSFSIIVSFYDENKKLIGTAQGIVSHIDVGDTKTFKAVTIDNISGSKSYKVNIDTMID